MDSNNNFDSIATIVDITSPLKSGDNRIFFKRKVDRNVVDRQLTGLSPDIRFVYYDKSTHQLDGYANGGVFIPSPLQYVVRLDPALMTNVEGLRITLIHELIHVALDYEELGQGGVSWKSRFEGEEGYVQSFVKVLIRHQYISFIANLGDAALVDLVVWLVERCSVDPLVDVNTLLINWVNE